MDTAKQYKVALLDVAQKRCIYCRKNAATLILTTVENYKEGGKKVIVELEEALCVPCVKNYYPDEVVELFNKAIDDEFKIEGIPVERGPVRFNTLPGQETNNV